MSNGYLLLHGWQNRRPPGHWHHWLASRLADAGHTVAYPQLPDPDEPSLDAWLGVLQTESGALEGDERIVVCHSLSCLLWLHAAARGAVRADRVLLVAPPSPTLIATFPEVAEFVPPAVTAGQLQAAAATTRVAVGTEDPYCPEGATAAFPQHLLADLDVLPGAGHVNPDSGYGRWPSVLTWCEDASVRLVP
jgi:predicted alpha/beta hydrolase family esterase